MHCKIYVVLINRQQNEKKKQQKKRKKKWFEHIIRRVEGRDLLFAKNYEFYFEWFSLNRMWMLHEPYTEVWVTFHIELVQLNSIAIDCIHFKLAK